MYALLSSSFIIIHLVVGITRKIAGESGMKLKHRHANQHANETRHERRSPYMSTEEHRGTLQSPAEPHRAPKSTAEHHRGLKSTKEPASTSKLHTSKPSLEVLQSLLGRHLLQLAHTCILCSRRHDFSTEPVRPARGMAGPQAFSQPDSGRIRKGSSNCAKSPAMNSKLDE